MSSERASEFGLEPDEIARRRAEFDMARTSARNLREETGVGCRNPKDEIG